MFLYAGPASDSESTSGTDTAIKALLDSRMTRVEGSINRLASILVDNSRPPPPPPPVVQEQASDPSKFLQQLKVMKEIMTLMLPPTPPTPSISIPVSSTPSNQTPTFDLDTMERLAKMFQR